MDLWKKSTRLSKENCKKYFLSYQMHTLTIYLEDNTWIQLATTQFYFDMSHFDGIICLGQGFYSLAVHLSNRSLVRKKNTFSKACYPLQDKNSILRLSVKLILISRSSVALNVVSHHHYHCHQYHHHILRVHTS